MSEFTPDIAVAQNYYFVATNDPRIAPGLPYPESALVVWNHQLFQKQSAADTDWSLISGGGGGGGAGGFAIAADVSVLPVDVGKLMMLDAGVAKVYQKTDVVAGTPWDVTYLENSVSQVGSAGANAHTQIFAPTAQPGPGNSIIFHAPFGSNVSFIGGGPGPTGFAVGVSLLDTLNNLRTAIQAYPWPSLNGFTATVNPVGPTIEFFADTQGTAYNLDTIGGSNSWLNPPFFAIYNFTGGTDPIAATSININDPEDSFNSTITAGVDWTPGLSVAADLTAIAAAMTAAWGAHFNIGVAIPLITITRNVPGLMLGSLTPTSWLAIQTSGHPGSAGGSFGVLPALGLLASLTGGIATIDGSRISSVHVVGAISVGNGVAGGPNGQVTLALGAPEITIGSALTGGTNTNILVKWF